MATELPEGLCGPVLNDAATQIIAVALVCLTSFHGPFVKIVFTDIFGAICGWPLSAFAAATKESLHVQMTTLAFSLINSTPSLSSAMTYLCLRRELLLAAAI